MDTDKWTPPGEGRGVSLYASPLTPDKLSKPAHVGTELPPLPFPWNLPSDAPLADLERANAEYWARGKARYADPPRRTGPAPRTAGLVTFLQVAAVILAAAVAWTTFGLRVETLGEAIKQAFFIGGQVWFVLTGAIIAIVWVVREQVRPIAAAAVLVVPVLCAAVALPYTTLRCP